MGRAGGRVGPVRGLVLALKLLSFYLGLRARLWLWERGSLRRYREALARAGVPRDLRESLERDYRALLRVARRRLERGLGRSVLGAGEGAAPHLLGVPADGLPYLGGEVRVGLGEWRGLRGKAEEVVED